MSLVDENEIQFHRCFTSCTRPVQTIQVHRPPLFLFLIDLMPTLVPRKKVDLVECRFVEGVELMLALHPLSRNDEQSLCVVVPTRDPPLSRPVPPWTRL